MLFSEMMDSEIHLHLTCADRDVIVRGDTADLPLNQQGGIARKTPDNSSSCSRFNSETENNLI